MEKLLDKKQLSEETGLTASFIMRAIAAYAMPHYKIGRNVKFKLSEVSKWIDQRRKAS